MSTKIQKNEKRPPMSSKNKMLIFGLIQLLMIGQMIWATNINWNAKKKKKNKKRPPMSSKNKMLIFGLCSTSDDWPSDLSDKHRLKYKKNERRPLCHQKIKCSFLHYIQLLMISWAIWATNIDQNAKNCKKAPPCHQEIKCSFLDYIQLLMIDWAIWATNVNQNTKKWKKAPYVIKK